MSPRAAPPRCSVVMPCGYQSRETSSPAVQRKPPAVPAIGTGPSGRIGWLALASTRDSDARPARRPIWCRARWARVSDPPGERAYGDGSIGVIFAASAGDAAARARSTVGRATAAARVAPTLRVCDRESGGQDRRTPERARLPGTMAVPPVLRAEVAATRHTAQPRARADPGVRREADVVAGAHRAVGMHRLGRRAREHRLVRRGTLSASSPFPRSPVGSGRARAGSGTWSPAASWRHCRTVHPRSSFASGVRTPRCGVPSVTASSTSRCGGNPGHFCCTPVIAVRAIRPPHRAADDVHDLVLARVSPVDADRECTAEVANRRVSAVAPVEADVAVVVAGVVAHEVFRRRLCHPPR